jgi:hypothetical protein
MLFALQVPPAILAPATPNPAPASASSTPCPGGASRAASPAPDPFASLPPGSALIRNSGSSNTLPYAISLRPDGSALVTVGVAASAEQRTVPQAETAELFAELHDAMPLDALPRQHCMKSASFGTTTTIRFGGAASPDLDCAGDPATRGLAATVARIVKSLGISVLRREGRPY